MAAASRAGRGAVAHLAEDRVADHRHQGAGTGDQRQAVRRPLDPDERVHLQGQGDQQRRDEQQRGAHVRQRVQRDKTPADPACRRWRRLQHSLGCVPVSQSAPRGIQPGVSPANRTTRESMTTRKAMVIPSGTVTRTVLAGPPAHEYRTMPRQTHRLAVRNTGLCRHRRQHSHRPQPLSTMAPAEEMASIDASITPRRPASEVSGALSHHLLTLSRRRVLMNRGRLSTIDCSR